MKKINLDTKIKTNPNIMERTIKKRLNLFNPKVGRIYYLNETAALIWHMARKGCNVGEIVDIFTKEFTVGKATAKKDIFAFINRYLEKNYIQIIS